MTIDKSYTIAEAGKYLSVPQKYLENYIKGGNEIKLTKIGRKKLILHADIEAWRKQREFNFVKLNQKDYLKCLEFAIRSFYAYRSTSDFGTAQQRDALKFVSNIVIGKLGKLAVSYFLKRNFDVDTKLDFDLRDAVVGQDVAEIAKPRRGARVYNPLKLHVAIKTSKMKNVWLIVPVKEVEDPARSSDIYIFSRVDLYLNHFLRILKEHATFAKLDDIIPSFEEFGAEVCGFIKKTDLIHNPPVIQLPSPKQEIQPSYIKCSGVLLKSKEAWENLINEL